jgi:hypothetical protein
MCSTDKTSIYKPFPTSGVCELAEPVNGLARIKISRAPVLGPARMVQVLAQAEETGRTRAPSAANPSRRRHP